MSTIGFIGCGNMTKYIISGMLSSGEYSSDDIMVFDKNIKQTQCLNVRKASKSEDIFESCSHVILAVKPDYISEVLSEAHSYISNTHVIVSIAAGVPLSKLESILGPDAKVIRVMPNLPVSVLAGCSSLTANKNTNEDDLREVLKIFDSVGITAVCDEEQFHAVTGISGSSPAYVFMFIEAMADAGVLGGLSRDVAYRFAAQAVMGSAKMVSESRFHPAELKDKVCSPGGTTIEAVRVLENKSMRSAVIEAVMNCIDKSVILSKR